MRKKPTTFNKNQKLVYLSLALLHGVMFYKAQAASALENAQRNRAFSGNVSWYGPQFNGKKTASGEIFDMTKLTAAHRTLPLPTRVMVEDPRTGNTVVVKVNDRGPYVKNRVMDLSREGAHRLGTLGKGVCFVDCTIVE